MDELDRLKLIAKNRNGYCLSDEYLGSRKKLLWKCSLGHIWEAIPANVKFGSWCSICAGNVKSSIEDIRALAKEKGGRLISDNYINSASILEWECKLGHRWKAKSRDIKNKHWCPICYGNAKLSYIELKNLSSTNNGYFISSFSDYKNNKTKLNWKCNLGHEWRANANSIKNGTWCPICNEVRKDNKFKTEEICREIFFEIFNLYFKRSRPIWLIGPKKYPLELDGFNEKLRIAFEYNGFQHYNEVNFFKINKEKIKYQREKEDLKINKCVEHGIKLIIIPFVKNPSKEKLKKVILSLLKEQELV